MSLTPPADMNRAERWGAFTIGLGILSLLVCFLGASPLSPWIAMGLAGTMLVTAGVLREKPNYRNVRRMLIAGGILSLALLVIKLNLQGWGAFAAVFGLSSAGAIVYFKGTFGKGPAGIKNNGVFHSSATRQAGVLSWMLAIVFTGFYVILYWFPDQMFGLVAAADPLYQALTGKQSYWIDEKGQGHVISQWFVYGLIYTLAVLVMGVRFIYKYRHNNYQILRTISVMTIQLLLAFFLPHLLEKLNHQQETEFRSYVQTQYLPAFQTYEAAKNTHFAYQDSLKLASEDPTEKSRIEPLARQAEINYVESRTFAQSFNPALKERSPKVSSHYVTYFWPLDYDILQPEGITYFTGEQPWDNVVGANPDGSVYSKLGFGAFGWGVIGIALFMSTIGVVTLTYFFGKRWYCSWVCGCGGLAETAGDPFRQQSDKSLRAWQIERYSIYGVLSLVSLITLLLLVDWQFPFMGDSVKSPLKSGYGFLIATVFSGVVGTGFYPILGSRVWCRFGCPQAALLGILQKHFSRFRITTNGSQCISCGNCSTYCEMGIDVKWYAQRGQDIARASCVGCGVCSAVCPRGVLNLENGPLGTRKDDLNPLLIENGQVSIKS